jgi:hypothetical protein
LAGKELSALNGVSVKQWQLDDRDGVALIAAHAMMCGRSWPKASNPIEMQQFVDGDFKLESSGLALCAIDFYAPQPPWY